MKTARTVSKKGDQKEVRLTLDAEAADLLLRMAGSPRKQGEYISNLIRKAAAQQSIDPTEDPTRQIALQVATQLTALTNQLLEIAGQPMRASGLLRVQSEGDHESTETGI